MQFFIPLMRWLMRKTLNRVGEDQLGSSGSGIFWDHLVRDHLVSSWILASFRSGIIWNHRVWDNPGSGIIWDHFVWDHLVSSWIFWDHLGSPGIIWVWDHLGWSGIIWAHLGSSGIIWDHLRSSGRSLRGLWEVTWKSLGRPLGSRGARGNPKSPQRILEAIIAIPLI